LPRGRLDGGNLVRLHDGSYAVGLKPGATGVAEAYLKKRVALADARMVIPVGLVNRQYLHLDMVLGNVGNQFYLVFEEALYGGRSALPEPIREEREVIFIAEEDAQAFAPNLVCCGQNVVTGRLSKGLRREMEARGCSVEELPLTEFYKAGGGAKCLTLPI
jgi:N-dimethylarginine dimethylaminohydrolase